MRTMPCVHSGIGGFDADPGALWPLGDPVGMAALGLLEVSLRDLGLRWRVLGVEELEVLAACADRGGRIGGRTPLAPVRVDCGGLCRCMRESTVGDWPGLVDDFVRDLLGSAGAAGKAGVTGAVGADANAAKDTEAAADCAARAGAADAAWSRVEGLIRSRVVPASVLPALLLPDQGPEAVVCRQLAEDLVEVVEVRSPDSLRLVRAGESARWSISAPAVLLRARENVRTDGRLDRRRFTSEGAALIGLSGAGHYAQTHLHWLRDYLADEPGWSERNGALVAAPHRTLLVAHVIESDAVEQAAGALARFAYRQFETCPGPVSDQLYWWCEDRLVRLPSDSVGETLQIFPTEAFAALLTRLRAES
jgi:hypothetical protein